MIKFLSILLFFEGAMGDTLPQKPLEDKVLILGKIEVIKPKKIGFFTFHKKIRKGLFVVMSCLEKKTLRFEVTDKNGLFVIIEEKGCKPAIPLVGCEDGIIWSNYGDWQISVNPEDLSPYGIMNLGMRKFEITKEGYIREGMETSSKATGEGMFKEFLGNYKTPWNGIIKKLLKAWRWRDKGDGCLEKKDTLSALSFYNKVMEVIPFPSVRKKLISIYDNQGKRDSVLTLIQQGIDLEPDNPERYREAGEYYQKYGMIDTAEIYYLKAIDIDSTDRDNWLRAADFYNEIEKREKAIDLLKKGIEVIPKTPSLYERLGDLYLEENEKREAMEMYEKVYKLEPDRWGIKDKLMKLYKELGEKEKFREMKG